MATGRKIRSSGMPAACMDKSSRRSPILPKVMSDASRMANGSDSGTRSMAAWKKNCASTLKESPLPMRSSTYFQINCIRKMKRQMKNVPINSRQNCFRMNMSIFLMIRIRA